MVAREATCLPSASRASFQAEEIEMSDLLHCLLGEVGVPEVHRVLLQNLLGCSLCRGLQLLRGFDSLGCLCLRGRELLLQLESLGLLLLLVLRELRPLLEAELS